jgi:asparagine synthetase B (glutamine-hydrolysing)
MCGVAGLFSAERPVDAGLVLAVLRMLDAEIHRGPDDWGILVPKSPTMGRMCAPVYKPPAINM